MWSNQNAYALQSLGNRTLSQGMGSDPAIPLLGTRLPEGSALLHQKEAMAVLFIKAQGNCPNTVIALVTQWNTLARKMSILASSNAMDEMNKLYVEGEKPNRIAYLLFVSFIVSSRAGKTNSWGWQLEQQLTLGRERAGQGARGLEGRRGGW